MLFFCFCLFSVFLLDTNCKKQDSCWRVRGCWQKQWLNPTANSGLWKFETGILSNWVSKDRSLIWSFGDEENPECFEVPPVPPSGFCCFLHETVQRFLQWKNLFHCRNFFKVVVSSTSIPLKHWNVVPQKNTVDSRDLYGGVTADLPDIWSTSQRRFSAARRGWLMWRQRTGKLVVSLSDGKGCAKGRTSSWFMRHGTESCTYLPHLDFFCSTLCRQTCLVLLNQVWSVVVVGRLALFFSQLPTANGRLPLLASWFVVLRWFFPFVFFSHGSRVLGFQCNIWSFYLKQKKRKMHGFSWCPTLAVCVLTLSEYIPGQSPWKERTSILVQQGIQYLEGRGEQRLQVRMFFFRKTADGLPWFGHSFFQ